eukprot:58392-Hanusia_phi.AAC.3
MLPVCRARLRRTEMPSWSMTSPCLASWCAAAHSVVLLHALVDVLPQGVDPRADVDLVAVREQEADLPVERKRVALAVFNPSYPEGGDVRSCEQLSMQLADLAVEGGNGGGRGDHAEEGGAPVAMH